ncbi:type I secretion C-terminal target domain-containing protein [Thauera sinica]|uniref:Type I secretion C-terminal target domain-containing protein n=1 Tax=Thauera sinica TaxID=2665146 RepID=A0ABW1AQ13_9RHOO|nr:type I secretion C-terminal target domain-containing protein [Thauera sp. K11]ATE60087.1 hypothetical protein CCZ27_09110 [Thauera sp. K11]
MRLVDFRSLDGGLGNDTLALDAAYSGPSDIVLADFVSNSRDLSGDTTADARVNAAGYHKLLGFEILDLSLATSAQTLTVAAADVNQLSETDTLYAKLGSNDVLKTSGFTGNVEYGYWLSDGTAYDRHWTGTDGSTAVELYGAGGDIFRFTSGESGADTVADFTKSQGDKLDLSGILLGMGATADNIAGFIQLTNAGSNAVIKIDIDGGANFGSPTQTITLTNAWTAGNLNDALTNLIDQRVLVI